MNQITRYHHLSFKTLPNGNRAATISKEEIGKDRYSNLDQYGSRRDLVLVKKESFLQSPEGPEYRITQDVRTGAGAGPSANVYGFWADRNDNGEIDTKEVQSFEDLIGETRDVKGNRYLTTNLSVQNYKGLFFIAEEMAVKMGGS